eukprot:1186347-Prorocentrum_minimum.AAC.3
MVTARDGNANALVSRPDEERAIVPKEKEVRVVNDPSKGAQNRTSDDKAGNSVPKQNGTTTSDPALRKGVKERKSTSKSEQNNSRSKSREPKEEPPKRDSWRKESGSVVSTERSVNGSESTDSFRGSKSEGRSNATKKTSARATRAGVASLNPQEDERSEEEDDLMKGARGILASR